MGNFHMMLSGSYKGLTNIETSIKGYYPNGYAETTKDGRHVIEVNNAQSPYNAVYYNKFEPNTQYKLSFEWYQEHTTGTGFRFAIRYTDGTTSIAGTSVGAWGYRTLITTAGKTVSALYSTYGTRYAKTYFTKGSIILEKA